MDPFQTAFTAIHGPHCLSMRLQIFSGRQKHTFGDFALQGLINVSTVCIQLGFS